MVRALSANAYDDVAASDPSLTQLTQPTNSDTETAGSCLPDLGTDWLYLAKDRILELVRYPCASASYDQ